MKVYTLYETLYIKDLKAIISYQLIFFFFFEKKL